MTNDRRGHREDAGHPRDLPRGQLGQLEVELPWQVSADVAHLRLDQVEVVEEPLGGGGDERPLMHVLGELQVRLAEDRRVVV